MSDVSAAATLAITPGPGGGHGPRRTQLEGLAAEGSNVKAALFHLAFRRRFVPRSGLTTSPLGLPVTIGVRPNALADIVAVFFAARTLASRAATAAQARRIRRVSEAPLPTLGACRARARHET